MSAVDISYKNEVIASLNISGKKTLLTSGKYCEDNIEIEYTVPTSTYTATISGTGSSSSAYVQYNNTKYYSSGSFSFSKDDELYICVYYGYGPVSIIIDGVVVRSGHGQTISYTYTLPGRDIDIKLTADNYAGYSVEINSGLITKSIIINGTYNAEDDDADGYSSVIVNVSSTSEASDAVRFIDYDGTILHEYSRTEFLALTAMPANPSHTGLTSQGWNWSLSDAKTYVTNWGYLDIGQMYVTTSGATEIDIEIPSGYKRLSPYLSLAVNGEVSIDWGDGSSIDSLAGTSLSNVYSINHTYSTTGNYTIKIGTTTGSYVFYETSNCPILNNNNASGSAYNTVYSSWIKRIRLGNGSGDMISYYAFQNCYSLSSITIPSSITSIGNSAFNNCYSLSSVTIPSGVINIKAYALSNCYSLSSVTIPSSVTIIDTYAFEYCKSLHSVTIPSSVTSIGTGVFQDCNALLRRVVPLHGLIKNEGHDYSINGTASVGANYVFANWYNLTSVTIPSNITSIGNYAFYNCYSLSSITIPSGVTSIGIYAFQYCFSLSSITIPSGVTSIGNYTFDTCYSLSSVTIPSGVTTIGNHVFSNCYGLSSVTIPSSVTSIGTYVFQNCYNLSSITIPSGVTSISNYMFNNCYSLSSVTIPSSVTSIGTSAFQYCRSLTSVTISSGVTSISNQAFSGCYGMKEYHFLSETPPTLSNTNALSGIPSDCIIYVPQGSLSAYQTATNWSTYASYMQEEPN